MSRNMYIEEGEMRTWVIVVAGGVAAVLSVWALAHVLPESWSLLPTVLYVVVVVGGAIGSSLLRRRRERADRSADEGSVEREIAQQAASGTLGTALVAMVGFGLYLVLQEQFLHAVVLCLLVVLVIAAFWVRYAIIRNRVT